MFPLPALHICCLLNHVDLIPTLVRYGADVGAKNNYGATCLHSACSRKRLQTLLALLKGGAPVNVRDNDGLTPLHSLCSSFAPSEGEDDSKATKTTNAIEIAMAKALVEAGADINSLYVYR